jgi:hypothetical protein
MNLTMEKIKRRGNQTHDSGKHERRANGFARGEPGKKQKSRYGETATANTRQADGERNRKSK